MKKAGVIITAFIILSFFSMALINCQESGLPPEVQQIAGIGEKVQNLSQKAIQNDSYLKIEWKKILENNKYVGPIFKFIFNVLDPISKVLIKREISFTWTYFLALALWIMIALMVFSPLKSMFNMHWIAALLSGIIIATFGIRAIPDKLLEFQLSLMWKIIFILVMILIAAIVKYSSDYVKENMKKMKEIRQKKKADAVERLHNAELRNRGIKS